MCRKEKIEVLERKIELAAKTFAMMSDLMREYADALRDQNTMLGKPIETKKPKIVKNRDLELSYFHRKIKHVKD